MGKLKDVTISFEKLQNLGNYENQKMSITVTIPEIEDNELEDVADELANRIYKKIDEIQTNVSNKQRDRRYDKRGETIDTGYLG